MTIKEYRDLIDEGERIEDHMLRITTSGSFYLQENYQISGFDVEKIKNFAHKAVQSILDREVN